LNSVLVQNGCSGDSMGGGGGGRKRAGGIWLDTSETAEVV